MASPQEINSAQPQIEIGIGTRSSFGALALPTVQGPDGMLILDGEELRRALNDQHQRNPFDSPLIFIPTTPKTMAVEPQRPEPRAYTLEELGSMHEPTSFYGGQVVVNPKTRQIQHSGISHQPALKVFNLIHLLSLEPGRIFSTTEIMLGAWGYTYPRTMTVHVHVKRARDILPDNSLITVRERGFKVEP